MGTAAQHEEKANHHLSFLEQISDAYPDWLATVAFYAAVEFVEALLAEAHDFHCRCHEHRNQTIHSRYPSIHADFKALYNASLDGRYQPLDHSLQASIVRSELIEKRLGHIRKFVESHRADGKRSGRAGR